MKRGYSFRLYSFVLIIYLLQMQLGSVVAQNIISVAGSNFKYGDGSTVDKAGVRQPFGIATDKYGNIYSTDQMNCTIRRIDANTKIVTVIAGRTYQCGFAGDGGQAVNALLNFPQGIFVDSLDNIYVADAGNERVRRIDKYGIITTIAGNGKMGFSGDGGPALKATFRYPEDIAADTIGNIYISDWENHRIRKINNRGIISTYAGNGLSGYSGDGDFATKARLYYPQGIKVDNNGNLYIADSQNGRVRVVAKNGIIHTVVKNTGRYPDKIYDLDIDKNGKLYFSSTSETLKSYDFITGQILELGDYFFYSPTGIAFNQKNNTILITESEEEYCYNHVPSISSYEISSGQSTRIIYGNCNNECTTGSLGDNWYATNAKLNLPSSVVFDKAGNIYIGDRGNFRIRKIDKYGIITTFAGSEKGTGGYGDGGRAADARFNSIQGMIFDKENNLFIADGGDRRVRKIDKNGFISTIAGNGETGYNGDGISALSASINPFDLALDNYGNLFISDVSNNRIRKVDKSGVITTFAGSGISGYNGDSIPAVRAQFQNPKGIFFTRDQSLLIADYYNHRIRKVDSNAIITTIAGKGFWSFGGDGGEASRAYLAGPTDVTCDKDGNIYIDDYLNYRIRRVDRNGIINTVVGLGSPDLVRCDGEGYPTTSVAGDGDPARSGSIFQPDNIQFDNKGNLFIADTRNHMLREVLFNTRSFIPAPVTTSFKQYVNHFSTMQNGIYLICRLNPKGLLEEKLNGNINSTVWVEKRVIVDSFGNPFLARHYELFTTENSRIQKTTITLFFTQKEFDEYNAAIKNKFNKLPVSPADLSGKSNLKIVFFEGKSSDTTGLPNSYDGRSKVINPVDSSIVWNSINKHWQVSFDVMSLGAFFISTKRIASSKNNIQDNAIKESESILVWPNPVKGRLNISTLFTMAKTDLLVISPSGKIVAQKVINPGNSIIDLGSLPAGLYILKFGNGEIKKIVKTGG